MKTFALFAVLAALGMGTVFMLRTDYQNYFPSPTETIAQTTNAAFRDGLYLGRIAAEHGVEPHVANGRWASMEDRASFTAGYQRGYSEFLASRAVLATRQRRAE